MAQLVKNLPAMQETWVQSLGWEDPCEKGKAIYSSILAWRIPGTVQSMVLDMAERLSLSLWTETENSRTIKGGGWPRPDHIFFHSQGQEISPTTHTQKSSMEVKGEWC